MAVYKGVTHKVKAGETLDDICRANGIAPGEATEKLVATNPHLAARGGCVEEGMRLFIRNLPTDEVDRCALLGLCTVMSATGVFVVGVDRLL